MNTAFKILALFAGLLAIAATQPLHLAKHHGEVDLEKSSITWFGKKVVGQHSGTINLKSGHLTFDNHKLTGGEFVMDMTTIACTDLTGKKAKSLEGHLSNEDFFEIEKYPTADLKITSASMVSKDGYDINGFLTIKGATHPIEFRAAVGSKYANATIMVDRTQYGIKYGSGSFFDDLGDRTIDNEFQLDVNLVLK